MKRMSLRLRLILGFLVMILLISAVSVLSIFRFSDVADLGREAVRENSNRAFALSREIDHLKWVSDVSDLFLLEDILELTVETDWHRCSLGEWIYGESLEEEMAADPELERLIAGIKPPHERLHKTAIEIDRIYVEFDQSLMLILENAWIDHLEWVKDLNYAVMMGTDFTGETDPRRCGFGTWYEGFSPEDPNFAELLARWEAPHNNLHSFAEEILLSLDQGDLAGARRIYSQNVLPTLDNLRNSKNRTMAYLQELAAGQQAALEVFNTETIPALQDTQEALAGLVAYFEGRAESAQQSMEEQVRQIIITVIVIALAALLAGLFLAVFTTSAILRQLGEDPSVLERIAGRVAEGDLRIDLAAIDRTEGVYRSVLEMVAALKEKSDSLEIISGGDFSRQIKKAGDADALGASMIRMQESLSSVLRQIQQAIDQVAQGADQVSMASQDLSQGATEQASSLEEISSSITEINGQASQNAASAAEASSLANEARDSAVSGNRFMEELVQAMQQINLGSGEIKKVVKVIDDIAFQINLLALNANVEAARAGKYGRGFAVVANEVRNLANRSAEAVRETETIVDDSLERISAGDKLVNDTAEQLVRIVGGIEKVASFLDEISSASREQAQGLNQITGGVEQIDEVTQANTASAEESASAAEELAGQADELRKLISQFKLSAGKMLLEAPGEEE
jgi:methyl-accepting chemotaxis protein